MHAPRCDGMIAFVSPVYFSRLWCVYEMAFFCNLARGKGKYNEQDTELSTKKLTSLLVQKLLLFDLNWPHPFSPCKTSWLTDEELKIFSDFSCLNCNCTKPADRAAVLGEIRHIWKTKDRDGTEVFDEFVQEKLQEVYRKSKQRYQTNMLRFMADAFDLAFGG